MVAAPCLAYALTKAHSILPLHFTSCICDCGIVGGRVWGEKMGFIQVNGVRGWVIVG